MLPQNLLYTNKLESAPARQYTSIVQPEGSQSNYAPNSKVSFNIPCSANTVLIPSECYLKLTLAGLQNGAAANDSVRLDGCGIHGVIQRIRVTHGSTELQDTDNYNMLVKLLMSLQQSGDGFMGKQSVMAGCFKGNNSAITGSSSVNTLIGEKLCETGQELYSAAAGVGELAAGDNIASRDYAINLVSVIGTMGGSKYVPLFEMTSAPLRLEIQFVNSVLKFLCSQVALVDNFSINNLELVCSFIELSDMAVASIKQSQMGQPLQYVVSNWANTTYNQTIQNGATTSVSPQISARYASLRSIFCTMRSRADGALQHFPFNATHFDLSQWRFRIGSQLIPNKQVSNRVETFCELLKAIGSVADVNHEPSLSYETFLKDAIPVASVEDSNALGANTKSNCFAIGLDLETYSNADKDKIFAGMNTLTSDIFLNADFAGAVGGANVNVKFDFYMLYDQVLVFENGSVRVVK